MAATPLFTLTATFQDLTGTDVGSTSNPSKLIIDLCGFGQFLPAVQGAATLAQIEQTVLSTNGTFNVKLWANDQISPVTTFYSITVVDALNRVVQAGIYYFAAQGVATTVDLSVAPQLVQPTLAPPQATETSYLFSIGVAWEAGTGPYALPSMPAAGTIVKLYYMGSLQIPGVNYELNGGSFTLLGFETQNGDNLYALYYQA